MPCETDLPRFDDLVLDDHRTAKDPLKDYKCPLCSREFMGIRYFKEHYMTHSGERPYPCPECTYAASRKTTLYKHLKLRHDILDYKC